MLLATDCQNENVGWKEKGDFRRKKTTTSTRIMSCENGVFENGRDKFFKHLPGQAPSLHSRVSLLDPEH